MITKTNYFSYPVFWGFFLLLFLPKLNAQSNEEEIPKHHLSLSYFGNNFTRPGVAFGNSYLFWHRQRRKTTKKGKVKEKQLGLSWENTLSLYNQKRNHTGVLLQSGITFTRVKKKGALIGIGLFLGYKRNFLNEDTYTVSAQGEITKVNLAGQSAFISGFQTRLGKDFSYKNPTNPWGWFLESTLYWEVPFGTTLISRNALELGITYKLLSK